MNIPSVYAIGGTSADKLSDIDNVLLKIFGFVWPFIGVGLLFMFISGGFMWFMSEGDPQRLAKAKSTMLWAVVGAIVIACISLILNIFMGVLKVNIDLKNITNIF